MSSLDDLWPSTASASEVEANLRGVTQCGEGISTDESDFRQCKEFSCGLWQTFHAMSVHKEAPMTNRHVPLQTASCKSCDLISLRHEFMIIGTVGKM